MESISNAANAAATTASKIIWGDKSNESGSEPVSGQTGSGSTSDPYDGGNKDEQTGSGLTSSTSGTAGGSTSSTSGTAGGPTSSTSGLTGGSSSSTSGTTGGPTSSTSGLTGGSSSSTSGTTGGPTSATSGPTDLTSSSTATGTSASTGGVPRPEHETDKTGVTSIHSNDPHGSDVRPTDAQPNVDADPSSAQGHVHKQQGGDRPNQAPSGEESSAIKEKTNEAEDVLKKRNPNDHSGEPMKLHDGHEGDDKDKPGQPGGAKKTGEEGTGEKWIKTSGVEADGGNFDAAQAGAGREADRLLETKGVHRSVDDASNKTSSSPHPEGSDDKGAKVSKMDKLKEKLHIGKH